MHDDTFTLMIFGSKQSGQEKFIFCLPIKKEKKK